MASTKILIVEDEEILASNLQVYLQRRGCDARIASTGKSAIAVAEEFSPELVLLDYHLSDMSGFEVLDAIRGANHCCRWVLMTGHPTDTVLADAQRRRVSPVLSKPFSMSGMVDQMSTAVKLCPATYDDGTQQQHKRPCTCASDRHRPAAAAGLM